MQWLPSDVGSDKSDGSIRITPLMNANGPRFLAKRGPSLFVSVVRLELHEFGDRLALFHHVHRTSGFVDELCAWVHSEHLEHS